MKYLQNKTWKINERVVQIEKERGGGGGGGGGGPTKNPKINKRGGTIIWNWRVGTYILITFFIT